MVVAGRAAFDAASAIVRVIAALVFGLTMAMRKGISGGQDLEWPMLPQTSNGVAVAAMLYARKRTGSIGKVPHLAGATGLEPATYGVTGRKISTRKQGPFRLLKHDLAFLNREGIPGWLRI